MNTHVHCSAQSLSRCRADGASAVQIPAPVQGIVRSSRQSRGAQRAHGLRPVADVRRSLTALRAAETEVRSASTEGKDEFIEVILEKPLGLRFTRGGDGAAYVTVNDATLGSTDKRIEIGDKVVQCSASFGNDVWDAKNFGQVMFAIRTRNGGVFLKFKRMFGDVSQIEVPAADGSWKREQNAGNVGLATREKQRKNYIEKKEKEAQRLELFNKALSKFRKNDIEAALIDFENVAAMEPAKFIGDNFARYTDIYPYAQYNAACCYSAMNQLEAGMEALEGALIAGFDDYDKVRSDPNLATLRKEEGFKAMVDKYDEPIINENAVRVLKNLFSFGKNQDDD